MRVFLFFFYGPFGNLIPDLRTNTIAYRISTTTFQMPKVMKIQALYTPHNDCILPVFTRKKEARYVLQASYVLPHYQ